MAGGDSTEGEECGGGSSPLSLILEIEGISAAGFSGLFKKDCVDLVRRILLLTHFLEEIRVAENGGVGSSSSYRSCFADLTLRLHDAKRLLVAANGFHSSGGESQKKIVVRFRSVASDLAKALTNFPHYDFEISEEVQEQVELVKMQLRRVVGRYGDLYSTLSNSSDHETDSSSLPPSNTTVNSSKNIGNFDHSVETKDSAEKCADDGAPEPTKESFVGCAMENPNQEMVENPAAKNADEVKRSNPVIPVDFLCPISLELMRDPVIVATGQTYERTSIQRWIDCGNKTCPKTQQKLRHLGLTPNHVLRSLISQWCAENNVDHPTALVNGKIRRSDGSFRDVTSDLVAVRALVDKLSSDSNEEVGNAVGEIRSMSKRSTDNRILFAEAGAIPVLVELLNSGDDRIRENAITCILNLSIYENNRGAIVLANAVPPIVGVLKTGTMEAKENAAATLFCLSIADENKIIIGASGAVPALIDLLKNGSSRGKKDAATALYKLCIYHGNKGRAVRAGIVAALSSMLRDSTLVDESLTIIAVLSSNHEAKAAIAREEMIPILLGLLRTDYSARNKENVASVLLSLCKRDRENRDCVRRLGGAFHLSELAKRGTDRARRKATALLELLLD
ncbi:hypothetical protein M569_03654 [Genlisea aurea]|uniref:U-box domain-containing protein 12 n=1 Tax=Genlisea aurea TaxID=192259 RepID=S8E5M9_9LAMI|nr:hypothetical protein M569_03654 [Genlisea aurea]